MPYNLKKILDANQIQKVDADTIKNKAINSLELMEDAALAFVQCIETKDIKHKRIAIVCGIGNNGGDGLAVTRILRSRGYSVKPYLLKQGDELSPDCQSNLNRLNDVEVILPDSILPNFESFDVIIDAIFGSGLSRPITGLFGEVIHAINTSKKIVYSIDLPSGMYCNKISNSNCIVRSDLTVSFQRPKLSFFLPEHNHILNKWEIVDIGLDEACIQSMKSNLFFMDNRVINMVKVRNRFSHKGTYGHALIIAGSKGKMGAAVLTARACLRSGVGLLTTHVPKCGYNIMQISVVEAMCVLDDDDNSVTTSPDLSPYRTIGIGPGLGTRSITVEAFKLILTKINTQSLVLDADALNILSLNKELLTLLPAQTILTPHPKELERLIGKWNDSIDRLQKQIIFSKSYDCIVVLKDAHTCITSPDGNVFFNSTGNPGMATGGSGDVLTGIITGVLAQGYSPLEAAIIGVYFHGKSGDEVARYKGQNALIASDIIDYLRIESN